MSTLRLTTISNQTGSSSVPSETVINGSAKAWVNFNGTGTVAIRASFNVSSITDNGTGNYTVNFTTAFADANYAFSFASNNYNTIFPRGLGLFTSIPTVNSITVKQAYTLTFGSAQSFEDTDYLAVAIFR